MKHPQPCSCCCGPMMVLERRAHPALTLTTLELVWLGTRSHASNFLIKALFLSRVGRLLLLLRVAFWHYFHHKNWCLHLLISFFTSSILHTHYIISTRSTAAKWISRDYWKWDLISELPVASSWYGASCSPSNPTSHPTVCTLLYSTLLYSTLLYSTLLYSTLLYSTLLYGTLLYGTADPLIQPASQMARNTTSSTKLYLLLVVGGQHTRVDFHDPGRTTNDAYNNKRPVLQ